MSDKEQNPETRTSPTQTGAVWGRSLIHNGLGVNLPEFAGWVIDWGKGILRSGAYLLTGRAERADYYANGPADRSLRGQWGRWGSMVIGQPLSEKAGLGHIRTRDGETEETGAWNSNVSFDSGKTWEKAGNGEGMAHWGGIIVDPTVILPLAATKSLPRIIRNTASQADKHLAVAGLATLGPSVGNDIILRGMILDPSEALDTLDILTKPHGLNSREGINTFNQSINFLLKEQHEPLNDSGKTFNIPFLGEFRNKNADSSNYLPSLDPDQGILQADVFSEDNYVALKDNYLKAALEIDSVISQAKKNIANNTAKIQDYELVRAGQKFDKRFNDIAQRYLAQGDRIDLTPTDTMVLNFKMHALTYNPMSLKQSETLGYLQEYLQTSYKNWAKTPGGETAIRTGVQLGALAPLDAKQGAIPAAHLRFMMSVQQNLVEKELNSFENPIVPLNRNDPGVATEAAKTALKTTPGLTMAP